MQAKQFALSEEMKAGSQVRSMKCRSWVEREYALMVARHNALDELDDGFGKVSDAELAGAQAAGNP
jgi:hypothetical protein